MPLVNPSLPNQIGYTPFQQDAGSSASSFVGSGSSVIFGRNVTGGWEGVGFGSGGRPNPLQKIVINLSDVRPGISPSVPGLIRIDVNDLVSIIQSGGSVVPTQFDMKFREVAVCEMDDNGDTTEKRMVVLASQTYAAPS